jgi:hypothetical protein
MQYIVLTDDNIVAPIRDIRNGDFDASFPDVKTVCQWTICQELCMRKHMLLCQVQVTSIQKDN